MEELYTANLNRYELRVASLAALAPPTRIMLEHLSGRASMKRRGKRRREKRRGEKEREEKKEGEKKGWRKKKKIYAPPRNRTQDLTHSRSKL